MKKILLSLFAFVMTAMTASAVDVPTYSLTKADGAEAHGTITFKVGDQTVTSAKENDVVTVIITPATGWAAGTVTGQWYAAVANAPRRVVSQDFDLLKDFEPTKVEGQDNQWTFTMKRANVVINSTYKKLMTNTDISIPTISAVTYTGQALTPAVTVKDGSTVLTKDVDYTVEYSNNVNAALSTATANAPTVTIKGIGDNYAGEITKTFTINPATLTSVTLTQTEFKYNLFEPVAQTAGVKEVKAGNLVVPTDQFEVLGNTQTEPGEYTVTVTGKTNFTSSVTTKFVILDQVVDGNAEKTETREDVDDIDMTLTVVNRAKKQLSIDKITESAASTGEDITVEIPATINGWDVVSVGAGAMDGMNNVTDIIMPDTEEPIQVQEGAFPGLAVIHTTLALLDDYALMASLQPNYEATKVLTTVTPANKYWTLGTGCDVILPEDVDAYVVKVKNTAEVATEIIPEELLQRDNERIIKANNGVLLLGEPGQSYDLWAYCGRIPSGMPIATTDNKDYGNDNRLEPVVEKKHYESGYYFVLQNNEFYSILAEGDEVKVPAGKAVLHLGNNHAGAKAKVLRIDDSATGLSGISGNSGISGAMYDLSGRKVSKAVKGIYIINGKKVVK